MFKLKTKHFLTGEELMRDELLALLDEAEALKKERPTHDAPNSKGKTLVMLFEKPSLRTRVSFSVAMQELGGSVIELVSAVRKKEEPEDIARVLAGYAHAVMVRTHEHSILEKMASKSSVPVINGLSDTHHPCQALADILTLKQIFGELKGLKLAYVGDGNNMLHSLMLLAPYLGIQLSYACPKGYEPNAFITRRAKARAKEGGGLITAADTPQVAVTGAHALYTDVWTSMGFEREESDREKAFDGYQLNEELVALAAPNSVVLHCMPMVRGKEITDAVADSPRAVLFQQSENRLHAQKALLKGLL
ncbi:MAG: ornithine carbamoyltransferase [Deltaproteobacteria bacterium]|nr:ornithine carbamoyltransferase [Deltaproteobacteria bacterium]